MTAGGTAVFAFSETPIASQGATLASPIALSVSGLPVGATASFSPAYLPPAGGPLSFTLTVQTAKTALLRQVGEGILVVALLLPVCLRRRRAFAGLAMVLLLAGCGARVKTAGGNGSTTANLVVTGTATSAAGAAIMHSVTVTLVVQ